MDKIIHLLIPPIARFLNIASSFISLSCLTIILLELLEEFLLSVKPLLYEFALLFLVIGYAFLQFLRLHLLDHLWFLSFKKNLVIIHESIQFLFVKLGKA